jgi:peptide/nickel transport system substrate-binding protein
MVAVACGSDDDGARTVATPAGGAEAPSASSDSSDTSDTSDTSDVAGSTVPADPTSSQVSAPTPSFEPGAGGTFRYAASLGVPMWDPAGVTQGFAPTYFGVVYDGLVLERSDGSLAPGLATEWEESDDAIAFTLREGVTFHDGTAFDADAVAYNIERVQQAANGNAALLSAIDEVEVVADDEVVLHLTERVPDLLNVLARMPGMMVSPNVAPEDIAVGVPAGTGPYRIVSFTEGLTVLERNPDYFDPTQQYADGVEFHVLEDPGARLNAVLTGQVDAADLPPDQAPAAEAAGFEVDQTVASIGLLTVIDVGGQSVPELADLRVRQAIAHSIDREAWRAAVGRGYGEPTFQFFDEDSPWYVEDWEGYDYDPERARELLAEAGVEQLRLDNHAFGPFLPSAQVLQQLFGDVGIDVEITQIPPGTLLQSFEAGLIPVGYTVMSANHPEAIWNQYFDPALARNAWGEVAPGADEARAAVADAPTAELDASYQDLLRVMYEEAWAIPIWVNPTLLAFDAERFPNVHGSDFVVLGVSIRELAPSS